MKLNRTIKSENFNMNRNKLKNIVLEEYQKIKHYLQEQSMGGQSMSPGGQPFMDKTPDRQYSIPIGTTIYTGVSSGNEVSIKTLKTYYEQDVPVNKRSNFSFNNYLDNMIKDKIITKQTTAGAVNQIGMPNETDKTTMALLAASSGGVQGGFGGTDEELFKTAIIGGTISLTFGSINLQGIKNQRDFMTVDSNIRQMLKTLNKFDDIMSPEWFYIRNGVTSAITKETTLLSKTGLRPTQLQRNAKMIVNFGIMSDKDLDSVGSSDEAMSNGIFGLIASEFDPDETEHDEILQYFIDNGFAEYDAAESEVKSIVPNTTVYPIVPSETPNDPTPSNNN
jgi:hypothetical protein